MRNQLPEDALPEDALPEDALPEGGLPPSGQRLVQTGELLAGSMARAAAALLFDPSSPLAGRIDPELRSCLSRAAGAAGTAGTSQDAGSPGERRRAGAALAFAVELSVTRSAEGRPARGDGFLDPGPLDRSRADELAEAVVLAARATVEEWRVRHLGYLFAEAAASPDLDAALVLHGLRLATSLSGRQWRLLAAVGRRERVHLPMTPLPAEPRGWTAWGAGEDLADLQLRGLLDPPVAAPRPGGAALPRLRMSDLRLTRRGVLVHRLLALDFVPEDAVAAALADLGLPRS